MKCTFRSRWAALLALPLLLGLSGPQKAEQAADAKVTIKATKLDDLFKTLATFKGKVVVIDFWADL